MKNLFITLSIVSCFLLNSCKKQVDTGFGNFTATFNSTIKKDFFIANVLSFNDDLAGYTQYYLNIVGTESNNVDNTIQISIISRRPITTKTYSSNSLNDELVINYDTPSYGYGEASPTVTNPMLFTITSINDKTIKGNFNGNIYLDNNRNFDSIIVTDGRFDLAFSAPPSPPPPLFYPGGGVTDVDGNTYTSVILNNKEWMVQNLRTSRYRNGDSIPNILTNTAWQNAANTGKGSWCYYNNLAANNNTYGKLYNEFTISDTREISPAGWHIPSTNEWNALFTYLGGSSIAGGLLKEEGLNNWASPNTGASNGSGFAALPGGIRRSNGVFTYFGQYGIWPTSDLSGFYKIILGYNSAARNYFTYSTGDGFSIRCVKD